MLKLAAHHSLLLRSAVCLAVGTLAVGCQSTRGVTADSQDRALTLSVAELQMHLRTDTYRTFDNLQSDGRDVFDVALWRLDRLVELRGAQYPQWQDSDVVIEYARARALERLRRYDEAVVAYRRVSELGGLLAKPAAEQLEVIERFAAQLHEIDPTLEPLQGDLAQIEASTEQWLQLAREVHSLPHASLALQEAEGWEQARVDYFAGRGEGDDAIAACQRLIERHRDSKLYPRHLIRLGDLYAERARRGESTARVQRAAFDVRKYEKDLEQALSAYELASETRKPRLRREAETRIAALLAYHEGVRSDVR